ncbi:hypothetical protein BV22DRAFT_1038577 [Leucogyrophana mollusca]|uniref:Uncharacterized protein n=1 Tax=Leucogyrophana mollusca TaxID=85980 RepID=A0ACB8B773_9AGAM|nr:hypothetical protein BV22DRAFT_1038577 [Leucogyrophana mollusca]
MVLHTGPEIVCLRRDAFEIGQDWAYAVLRDIIFAWMSPKPVRVWTGGLPNVARSLPASPRSPGHCSPSLGHDATHHL